MGEPKTSRPASEYAEALRILTVDLRLQVYAERGRRGLSLRALAAELGVPASEISRFEMAAVPNPTVATLERYIDWLAVSQRRKMP